MYVKNLHSWKVGIGKAIQIQEELKKRIILDSKLKSIAIVAGVDVGFSDKFTKAAVCLFGYENLRLIETAIAQQKINFPYVPGLLTFREGKVILKAFRKIKLKPDVILFDGQGICHPRKMGIATHLGIILNTPSIGCAKSYLCGLYKMPGRKRGNFSVIRKKDTREIIGVALRTRTSVKPLFVSSGYKISLNQARKIVLKLSCDFRIPQPLRYAHRLAKLV